MTPLKQLLRQPVRLIAVLLLLSMAAAFFSLSAGVFASAEAALDRIKRNYVTIGVPTTETTDVTVEYDGVTLHHEESVISREMWAYMDQLADEGTIIKGAYRQNYISAYSPSIRTVTSGKEDGAYMPSLDDPYNRAIFAVRVVSAEDSPQIPGYAHSSVSITAVIEDIVKLHPDYAVRGTLRFVLNCNSQEEIKALGIVPGRRYLISGSEYRDCDLELRTTLANSMRCSVKDIDLFRISYDLTDDERKTASSDFTPVAKYTYGDKTSLLSQNMVDQIDSCFLNVTHWHGLYPDDQQAYAIDGSETGALLNEQYLDAYMTPLDTDLADFLASDAGAEWQDAIREMDIQYHTISVIGTDLLESMYCFHQKDSFVTEGRRFSDAEYQNGAKVCLISETTALASGLGVGDEIELAFYWGPDPLADLTAPEWNVQPQRYSQKVGLSGGRQTYRIIGIYRQTSLWDTASYRFLPNTVFVPNASITEDCYTSRKDVFFTYILHNGRVSELRDTLTAQDYPTNILLCFDNGYSEIADTLHGFCSSAAQLLFVACLTNLAALSVFLVLFVNRQRRTVGRMLTLGSGRKAAIQFSYRLSTAPVLLASIVGAIGGTLTLDAAARSLFSSVSEVLDTSLSSAAALGHAGMAEEAVSLPIMAILAAALYAAVYCAAAYIHLSRIAKKSPLDLIRKG